MAFLNACSDLVLDWLLVKMDIEIKDSKLCISARIKKLWDMPETTISDLHADQAYVP